MILILNGPNLNGLGKQRSAEHYGAKTLDELTTALSKRATELSTEVKCFQSNHEGELIDFIQQNSANADGIVVNPAALTRVGFSLLDALIDAKLPFVEVHLSNLAAREEFRQKSIFSAYAVGTICGLQGAGYIYALEYLVSRQG